ncbi:hypothetical protein GQ55_4G235500 [Panicum hallii var. hallii]|uniref:Uncharacterized protein n=1 Tax=Panicum hallii var. hallii TaxID=1504633 RepID=A0A2T7DZM7_9POAL|nr:hypothetical protein GQ55_4G235500 [Panicum hallii var. hallii]
MKGPGLPHSSSICSGFSVSIMFFYKNTTMDYNFGNFGLFIFNIKLLYNINQHH